MLHRMQIQLTPEQAAALKRRALLEGVSVSELIRRAVDRVVDADATTADAALRRRARRAAGRFRSGHADTSTRHDRVLSDAYR